MRADFPRFLWTIIMLLRYRQNGEYVIHPGAFNLKPESRAYRLKMFFANLSEKKFPFTQSGNSRQDTGIDTEKYPHFCMAALMAPVMICRETRVFTGTGGINP